ncbi:S-layer homology domain-containing protein [Alteribacillus sp. JSM 102045]|uniref:S-layer homology domain-containing protein n=1 Tax=Alteribacillus sp. JSM 102045 TaxID=1562101 RepID=UPI0035BFB290
MKRFIPWCFLLQFLKFFPFNRSAAYAEVDLNNLNSLHIENRLLEFILPYEDSFSQNSYQGDINTDIPFTIKEGSIPILVSAPHATEHLREGNVKKADIYTGSISAILHELTGSYLIQSSGFSEDPNYIEAGDYKQALKQIVEENDIKYVIDLHGSARHRDFNIDLGTINGQSIKNSALQKIKYRFESNGIDKVAVDHTFSGLSGGTIVNYSANNLGVEAVQLEISRAYRDPRNDMNSFYTLLLSLNEIINELNDNINQETLDSEMTFNDVPFSFWGWKDIYFVFKNNWMKGQTESTFSPNAHLTRSQAAVTIVRALELEAKEPLKQSFEDVSEEYWAFKEIEIARQHGIIGGYKDGTFGPGNRITREQIAAIFAKTIEDTTRAKRPAFKNVNSSRWSFDAIMSLSKKGIINGYQDNTFIPGGYVTRSQLAFMLHRYAQHRREIKDYDGIFWDK